MASTLHHWKNGAPYEGTGGRFGDVTNPATGEVTAQVALASEDDVQRGRRLGGGGLPAVAGHLAGQADPGPVRVPRAAERPQGRAGRDHHRRARQGAVRRARRGDPRPGGRRVRLRHPAPAQGRVHRERLDQGRRALGPAAARRGRHHLARSTSRPWCRCGSSRSPSPPGTPWWSSRARRTRRRRCGSAELWREAGLPDGVYNVLNGDKVAVDGLLTHPDVASISFVGSTPIARYIYETGTAHGKRVQALGGAKNHMLVLPDADLDLAADQAVNAGFGSAGERCMAISAVLAVGEIGDDAGGQDRRAGALAAHRRRDPRLRHGPAGHRPGPGPGGRLRRRRRGGRGAAGGRRAAAGGGRRRRRVLRRADAVRPGDAPT